MFKVYSNHKVQTSKFKLQSLNLPFCKLRDYKIAPSRKKSQEKHPFSFVFLHFLANSLAINRNSL